MSRRRPGGYLGGSSIVYVSRKPTPSRSAIDLHAAKATRINNLARSTARYALNALAAGQTPTIPHEVRPLVEKAGGLKKWIRKELGPDARADKPGASLQSPRQEAASRTRTKPPAKLPKPDQKVKRKGRETRGEFQAEVVVKWYDHEEKHGLVTLVGRSEDALLPSDIAEVAAETGRLAPGTRLTCWITKRSGRFQVVQIAAPPVNRRKRRKLSRISCDLPS